MDDTLALLNFFVRNNHLASNEKQKIKKLIANIFIPLFGMKLKLFDYDENKYKENSILYNYQIV